MIATLAALTFLGLGSSPLTRGHFVGDYAVVLFDHGKPVDENGLPPGQIKWLELHKDGTFLIRDMLSGFEGKWNFSKGKVTMTILVGPAGKLPKPNRTVYKPKPDRSNLVPIAPQGTVGSHAFRYDPNVKKRWEKRMRDVLGQSRKPF